MSYFQSFMTVLAKDAPWPYFDVEPKKPINLSPLKAARQARRAKIEEMLRAKPQTMRALCAEVGISIPSMHSRLHVLMSRGLVVCLTKNYQGPAPAFYRWVK